MPIPRRLPARRLVPVALVAFVALVALAGCGSPQPVRRLDGEPDLTEIANRVPRGFSASAAEELKRLRSACLAIDPSVTASRAAAAPAVGPLRLEFTDGQCAWVGAVVGSAPVPELFVGILSTTGATTLDQTAVVLKQERSVSGVGDRARFDPETATLYVLKNGRLWYLQRVGNDLTDAPRVLTTLGRALVQTPAAR